MSKFNNNSANTVSGKLYGRNKLVLKSKLKFMLLGLVYGMGVSMPAIADDTEIYTSAATSGNSLRPNVMFLLDTSNSMGANVTSRSKYIATEDYSDTSKYPGTGVPACFDRDKIYRASNNAQADALGWCASGKTGNQIKGIAKIENFFCENAKMIDQNGGSAPTEAADSNGFYKGRVGRYKSSGNDNSKRWIKLNKYALNEAVECGEDANKHGRVAGDGRKYATKYKGKSGNSRWVSNSSNKFNWSNVGRNNVYTGNYMNYLIAAPDDATYRIEVIRDVMVDFVEGLTDVNLGFMPYSKTLTGSNNHSKGGMVEVAIDNVENTRDDIIDRLKIYGVHHDAGNPGGKNGHNNLVFGTPSSRQYYEALRYFKGVAPDYGSDSTAPSLSDSADCSPTETGNCVDGVGATVTPNNIVSFPSVASSLDGDGTYKSPISNECQSNFVILLTDGQPYADPIDPGQLTQMGIAITDTSCTVDPNCATKACANSCLAKFAEAGAKLDATDTFTQVEPISTFTIAFNANVPILAEATQISKDITGKGESFVANNASELETHLRTIVDALSVNTTFSSPAVSVNAFNRSVHLDDLYFTLFKPGKGTHWDGNLKKYKLGVKEDSNGDPILDADGNKIPVILDASTPDPVEAIDPATGFFADAAKSYWSTAVDGSEVAAGGVVDGFTNTRNVYTYTGGYTTTGDVEKPDNTNITAGNNKIARSNKNNVTAAMLNIDPVATTKDGLDNTILYHEALLDWAAGLDILDENGEGDIDDALKVMGDPLHSQPAIVQYGSAASDLIAYVATNDGFLHAIDTSNGEELWSFIPQELLPLLAVNYENVEGDPKSYGLDGNVVAWIDDKGGDGTISGTDKVRLYVSQRRGGNRIYAFDVTNRTSPTLEWIIEGGVPGTDYEELGQTWSTINVEQVKNGASTRTVLIFGGGYDADHDDDSAGALVRDSGVGDSIGRTVFIADATSGEMLWSAGHGGETTTNMDYAIPARVKPLDVSGDGNVDRLYVSDLGGQLFRFDIDESAGSFSASSIKGGRIADLAVDNSLPDARRFYYPPDVAIVAEKGKAAYLGIAIASGYRSHPNNEDIHDRIYLLKDRDVFKAPATYTTLTESDLYDATLNFASEGDGSSGQTDTAIADLGSAEGWYIKLDDEQSTPSFVGEKGLAEPLIIEGNVIVTTFVPSTGAGTNVCEPKEGSGKVFFLDIIDATASYPSNSDVRADRHVELGRAGIPASPNVIITNEGVPTTCIGTECRSLGGKVGARKTFWYEVEQ